MSNNNSFWIFIIVFLVALMSIFAFSSIYSVNNSNGNAIGLPSVTKETGTISGDVQIVKLKAVGLNYILEPSEVKKGIPVRIEADMSNMPGCSRSVVISAFNIRKVLSTSDNTLEFTPNQAGTFNIACSMNMYRGTFTVLESDGTKVAYVQPASTSGGSCGSSGGCGCGGAR